LVVQRHGGTAQQQCLRRAGRLAARALVCNMCVCVCVYVCVCVSGGGCRRRTVAPRTVLMPASGVRGVGPAHRACAHARGTPAATTTTTAISSTCRQRRKFDMMMVFVRVQNECLCMYICMRASVCVSVCVYMCVLGAGMVGACAWAGARSGHGLGTGYA
jgi:hypothetical protein